MIEYTVEIGESSREEAEAFFNLNNYILQSTVFALLSGVITSAIAALIMRRKPSAPTSKTPDLTGI
jgi:cell division protein FtsX